MSIQWIGHGIQEEKLRKNLKQQRLKVDSGQGGWKS